MFRGVAQRWRTAAQRSRRTLCAKRNSSDGAAAGAFWVNGQKHSLREAAPDAFLIDHLRSTGSKGAKLACGEGGCGACTVTVSHFDKQLQQVVHRPLNSCLVSLPSIEGMHVTTVEGLGNCQDGLHPVQNAMTDAFASQCGFCSTGFVMSFYTALLKNKNASAVELEKAIDGNLCRCTGYRPIADVVHNLAAGGDENAQFVDKTTAMLPVDEMKEIALNSPMLHLKTERGQWFAPRSMQEFFQLKLDFPDARIVVGNSELGVEQRFKHSRFTTLISTQFVSELQQLEHTKEQLSIGSAVNLTQLWAWLESVEKDAPAHVQRVVKAITDQIHWFSGTSIRSGASLAGNIVTASPISDLNPVWMALDASFVLYSSATGERVVSAKEFFTGYREVDLRSDEVLTNVIVPLGSERQFVKSFKQAQRREDDIAIATGCFSVTLDKSLSRVEYACVALGGMAPKTIRSLGCENALIGQELNEETLKQAEKAMLEELALPSDVPGGRPEYRVTLCMSFLKKFFLHVQAAAHGEDAVDARARRVLKPLPHSVPVGKQDYEKRPDADKPVGENAQHTSAARQVTGEAVYTDDLAPLPDELHAALATSTRAHASIKSVNIEKALKMEGVRGVYTADDVPGVNMLGDIIVDEQVLATDRAQFVGQAIAIVVADDPNVAKEAARAVEITYGDLNTATVLTIDDALEHDSFFDLDHALERGNVSDAMMKAEKTIEGTVYLGGQEHFYFEPMVTVAQPLDGEMIIYSSTQNIHKTQEGVAHVLGMPMNKVSAQVRRLGGGFGGKETSNIILSGLTAIAAHNARRPVRLLHGRDEDMQQTGKRHPFRGAYKVGFSRDGVIQALDIDLINNGGYSFDLSGPVLDRALLHSDNAYFVPNMRVRGRIAKTNLPSNTAFRGFGGPQGMLIAEHWIEHIANETGLTPEQVRERNLYDTKERNLTHYNQAVDSDMNAIWQDCVETSDYEARLTAVKEFNAANKYRKRGLSMVPSKFGLAFTFVTLNQATSLVHIYTDGSVLVNHGGVEMGQGLHTKVQQVAARTLGVPLSAVYLQDTNSEKVANASPTAASMGSDLYGMATQMACEVLSARLAPFRDEMGPNASFKDVVMAAYLARTNLSAQGFYKVPVTGFDFETGEGVPFSYYTSGAACTEVELDTLTGDWRALRTDIVMDVGSSINPAIDIGQIEGAFVQGQGWLTTEDLVFGGANHAWLPDGHLFAPGPGSYKIPAMDDIPRELNVRLMRGIANSKAVYSSRGIGEPPILLSGSVLFALRNAVHHARAELGVTDADGRPLLMPSYAPITSERLRMACADPAAAAAIQQLNPDANVADFVANGSF